MEKKRFRSGDNRSPIQKKIETLYKNNIDYKALARFTRVTTFRTPLELIQKRINEYWKSFEANKDKYDFPNLLEFYIYVGIDETRISKYLKDCPDKDAVRLINQNIRVINMAIDKAIENDPKGRIIKMQTRDKSSRTTVLPIAINLGKAEDDKLKELSDNDEEFQIGA